MAGGLLRWLCLRPVRCRRRHEARLVVWGGETRAAEPGTAAGEVMVEHGAGHVVCRADGFRIGRPAPVLAIEDRLEAGQTYLVVPVDRLPHGAVTAASLAALSYGKGSSGGKSASLAGGVRSPFEYVKDNDGRTVIRVTEEFVVNAVTGGKARSGGGNDEAAGCGAALCSTPELRKHYEQLVGAARGRAWSPRLDTIKERKGKRVVDVVSPRRCSPVACCGGSACARCVGGGDTRRGWCCGAGRRGRPSPGGLRGRSWWGTPAAGHVACRADGFRIGRPAQVLAIEDRLEAGRTYLVVPVVKLPHGAVTAASLAALSCGGKGKSSASSLAGGSKSPFEYVKDEDGRTVIRGTEEFVVNAVTGGKPRSGDDEAGGCGAALCSTPELRKHYEQLVGAARGSRSWSPRLDTIKERKGRRVVHVVIPGRCSPVRLLGISKGLS
ncbi:hypothetical protein EJB05_10734, partial [Eragrostis curvula]